MRLSERTVTVILNEEPRGLLGFPEANPIVLVQDTDDIGLWVRVDREDGPHILLIRWEYIWSIDFPAGEPQAVGLRPGN